MLITLPPPSASKAELQKLLDQALAEGELYFGRRAMLRLSQRLSKTGGQ